MTDNLSNNIPTPFTPSGNPSVLPDSPPPTEVAVDPIPPLPSMSASAANQPSKFGDPEPKVETVIEPDPPKPVEKPVTPPPPSVPEENPAIRPPGTQSAVGDKSGDPYVKKHHGLPKVTIAGIASLVFLVVALGSGLYLTRQKQDLQTLADGCGCYGSDQENMSCIPGTGVENNGCPRDQKACCSTGGGGGERPTDSPPQQGCVVWSGPGCGNDNQGFCTRCPDGAGGRTEYYCNSPNEGSGGGCRAPSGGGGGGGVPTDTPNRVRVSYFCSTCQPGGICQENFTMGNGGLGNPCSQVDECDSNGQNCQGIQWCADSCSGSGSGGGGGGGGGDNPTSTPVPTATPMPPTATSTPATISANCESLVGQVSNGAGGWTTKTDAEFAASARPGDGVRFVCTGHKTQGAFTKSAFFINNILHVDDVVKLNENQFAVEYTIPAAGSLEVESVLLHDTKGWVD